MSEEVLTAEEWQCFTEDERRFLAWFRQLPDYEKPPVFRGMTRIKNGVPAFKVEALWRQELTLARAKAHHAGKD